MTAFPRSPSPSPAPNGTVRASLASAKSRIDRQWSPSHEGSFGQAGGALYYVLSNHFYIGEVKYKDEILPGEQPAIMDRALFDAVQQKLTDQWTTRSTLRNANDHLLTGLLFDDAGHRMVPTHATKAGVRYRYYISLPHLYGESKTASVGSVSRVPASDIEDTVVNFLARRLIVQKKNSNSSIAC